MRSLAGGLRPGQLDTEAAPLDRLLCVMTAAAPPNPVVLERLEGLGAGIVHTYGLTETFGPYTVCRPQVAWVGRPRAKDQVDAAQRSPAVPPEDVRMNRLATSGRRASLRHMGWDDDERYPELSDDPEAVERRRQASLEMRAMRQKILRWAYGALGFLIVLVIYLAAR